MGWPDSRELGTSEVDRLRSEVARLLEDKRDFARTLLIMANDIDELVIEAGLSEERKVYYDANNGHMREVLARDPDLRGLES